MIKIFKRLSDLLDIKPLINGANSNDVLRLNSDKSGWEFYPDSIENNVSLVLSTIPRLVYWVYGNSSDGGTTPDTTTQASIDALLTAGVPLDNIRWLYEVATGFVVSSLQVSSSFDGITIVQSSGVFNLANSFVASYLDNITLIDASILVFEIANMSSLSSSENISLVFAGGIFEIANSASSSTIENITITSAGLFELQDAFSASSIENIVLVLSHGIFNVNNLTDIITMDNVTITEQETVIPADDFNRANGGLGANWTVVESTPLIFNNALTGSLFFRNIAIWTANSFSNNQYVEAKVASFGTNIDGTIGLTARYNVATNSGYLLRFYTWCETGEEPCDLYIGPAWSLDVYTNGEYASNISYEDYYDGPLGYIRLEVSGTTFTIKAKDNLGDAWTTIGSETNSTYSSGPVGVIVNGEVLDDFAAGDL